MRRVLILGAGMVARPMVEYLLERDFRVLIASPMKERADEMIAGHPNGSSADWSMDEMGKLDEYIASNDIIVSLLPYRFHSEVAKLCIKNRKSLVTTSYVQPSMESLDSEAEKAGILLLNEIGLDPGLDHMSAMKIIDQIHSRGGKVEEFYSLCGALPAPEAADNPLGYKFSWSPKGVVLASRNSALYLRRGTKISIEPADLFKDRFTYNFPGVGDLEVYPNRDSISYTDIYKIPEVSTMYRGTFRYKGWCETLDVMKSINMLDDTPSDFTGMSFADFTAYRAGLKASEIKKDLAIKLSLNEDSAPIKAMEWLGFFSLENMAVKETTPFEITSDRMISRMQMNDRERDMAVMQHIFLASFPSGSREVIKSSMLDFGTPATNTAIARTVALPASIAVKLILEGKISLKGVNRPVYPEIYNPVLQELSALGIEMNEEWGLDKNEINF
jgi:saccharopine dehydrogenase (NADP+, L-glutamate forming)